MIVTVMGLGLIGGSIAKDIKERDVAKQVIGVDANPHHASQALTLGLVDHVEEDFEEALLASNLFILAMPVGRIREILPQVVDATVSGEKTILEVGSTKHGIADAVRGHSRRNQIVLSHPMAGTEFSGPTAAKSGLFEGRTVVICDAEQSGSVHLQKVLHLYDVLGANVTYMESAEQDMHTAYVSHLSHISSFMLANTVLDIEKNTKTIFELASGGFESTVRLAKSSPATWNPIFEQNKEYVLKALRAYIEHLSDFRDAMERNDWDRTLSLLERANEIKRVLEGVGVSKKAGAK